MQYYLAPLEGITGYVYRNAYEKVFHNVDKYFTPFLSPTKNKKLTSREKNDVLPEHNKGMYVVPQILTNCAEHFLDTVIQLKAFGYQEVNLNLGCPSGTVVTKKKGAGFLSDPAMLDEFLDEIFRGSQIKISVKTRLGMESIEEFPRLMEIFNRYPMEELIVHPRVQKDFYKNVPQYECYEWAMKESVNPLCYNGDIFGVDSFERCLNRFPKQKVWMLGRGIIGNPGLIGEIKDNQPPTIEQLKQFHDEIYGGYEVIMSGERNVLFKMKELWFYMGNLFEDSKKELKQIKKATKAVEYKTAVNTLFREKNLKEKREWNMAKGGNDGD